MSNSKDKRIKKLRKLRVWPSIVGLFVITFIFAIILIVQLWVNMLDVIRKKVIEPSDQAKTIAELFEGYSEEQKEKIENTVLKYIEVIPDIDAVWVSDLNNNKVWSNKEIEPNIEEAGELPINENETITLIFDIIFSPYSYILSLSSSGITCFIATIAHSIILSSGSRTVMRWNQSPGAEKNRVIILSCLPASFKNS